MELLKKISTIQEALDEIKKIDLLISQLLDKEEYEIILGLMKDRLVLISEMTRIKKESGISEEEKEKLDQVFSGANNVMEIIQKKMQGLKERLDKSRKIAVQNKKINYK